jgi:hypothetical protein
MKNYNLTEFNLFSGFIKVNNDQTPVTFRVRINTSGKAEFDFNKIERTKENIFIENQCETLSGFYLYGKSESNIEIIVEKIYFSINIVESINSLKVNRYSTAKLTIQKTESKPRLMFCLKGFEHFSKSSLHEDCSLGAVSMVGSSPVENPDKVTGYIAIEPKDISINLSEWYEEVMKLLTHIHWIMSFACGFKFQVPMIEFHREDKVEITFLSQRQQSISSSYPVISIISRSAIFKTSVSSFNSPKKIQNLYIAIDWFITNPEYLEGRLIAAITALENLLASNLDEKDKEIVSSEEFEKYRKTLRQVIKKCVEKWSSDKQGDIVSKMNEGLLDLNRRSLRQKIDILAKRWSVKIDDIDETKIKAAIKARNLITHQGHCSQDNLLEHIAVIRELTIRFLFTSIGYQGEYISHLGGFHKRQFPSKNNQAIEKHITPPVLR